MHASRSVFIGILPNDLRLIGIFLTQAIESSLRNQPGILSIKVALLAERAVIEYDPDVWTTDKLVNVRGLSTDRHVSY